MKFFWLLIVLLLAGGVYLAMTPRQPKGVVRAQTSEPVGGAAAAAENKRATGGVNAGSGGVEAKAAATQGADAAARVESGSGENSTPAVVNAPVVTQADAVKAEMALSISESLGGVEGGAGAISVGEAVVLPVSPRLAGQGLVPAEAKRVPIAGKPGLKVDDEFLVAGSGTKDDPYVVSFEHLASAANLYNPRKGLSKLPQRVAFMDGAWVKITGYIAFPVSATDATELLVMQNQWDGCCIGVPPTAYDAVEVKLGASVRGAERFSTYGAVVGRLKVDPYIDANWLLGLYVMEEGTLFSEKTDTSLQSKHNQP
jgi:hypothetical protein